jgi:hypothetical protein
MASPHSDTMTSQRSLMNSGKLEAVQTDHRKRIGSMPRKNYDPALIPVHRVELANKNESKFHILENTVCNFKRVAALCGLAVIVWLGHPDTMAAQTLTFSPNPVNLSTTTHTSTPISLLRAGISTVAIKLESTLISRF